MAKIIFIGNLNQETTVATFKKDVEAFQAASLFNAILPLNSSFVYVVEYKVKGATKRTIPDNLRQTVDNLVNLKEHLKPIFNN